MATFVSAPLGACACVVACGATYRCLVALRERLRGPPQQLEARVLSLQSHVVHGYVGNKCAVFPLQLLGLQVDFINTVQFSNHTGYPSFRGQKLDGDAVRAVVDGLRENGLTDGYTHLLTGYMGSADFLRSVHGILQSLRAVSPGIKYFCDPVMGDNGKLYLPAEMVPLYRELVREAHTITPNQFEAEQLSQMTIGSLHDAIRVCDFFHSQGVQRVVITSLTLPERPGELLVLGSEDGKRCAVRVPLSQGYFTGTGDLLAALLLGWGEIEPTLAGALEKAVGGVQAALRETLAHYRRQYGELPPSCREQLTGDSAERSRSVAAMELRLVQCRDRILRPPLCFSAEPVECAS